MINNFTTPAFSQKLKEFGIEIETPFYHINDCVYAHGYGSFVNLTPELGGLIICGKLDALVHYPAYLLTEVLRWLPNVVTINKTPCILAPMNAKSGKYKYLGTMHWDIERTKFVRIEDLILQGLTEGWLTKETILNAIKENAK